MRYLNYSQIESDIKNVVTHIAPSTTTVWHQFMHKMSLWKLWDSALYAKDLKGVSPVVYCMIDI